MVTTQVAVSPALSAIDLDAATLREMYRRMLLSRALDVLSPRHRQLSLRMRARTGSAISSTRFRGTSPPVQPHKELTKPPTPTRRA